VQSEAKGRVCRTILKENSTEEDNADEKTQNVYQPDKEDEGADEETAKELKSQAKQLKSWNVKSHLN
jgi:hypothetical protein